MFPVDRSVRLIGLFTGLAALCEAIAFFGAGLYAYEQTHSTVAAAMLAVLVVGANILWLTIVMTLATLCASPIRPAISAALPNLVVHDELDSANGYVQAWRNGAMTLGPVAVGVGAGLVGARGLFVVASAALLLGVVVLGAVRGEVHAVRDADSPAVSESPFAGITFFRRDPILA